MNEDLASALAEFNAKVAREKKQKERNERFSRVESWYVSLVTEFLKTNKPTLEAISNYKVPEGYEQEDWETIIAEYDTRFLNVFQQAGNAKISGFQATHLNDIGTKHNGMALAVEGKAVSLSEREPDPLTIKWRCLKCDRLRDPAKYGRQPIKCDYKESVDSDACTGDQFDVELMEDTKDLQAIRIQQDNHTLSVIVRDESLINSVKAGSRAYAFGVMVFEPYIDRQTKKAKFRKYLEATNIECEDRAIQLMPEDIERFKADMEQPQFYERTLAAFAPHIYGMEAAKEAIMLSLASIGMRKPARILMIGDPGVAKSELMEYGAMVAPNGIYVTMANTRHTGLTTTSEKDEETGRWMVTPGVLAWADAIFLDEFQVIKEQDAKNLNDVIESGKIRYALAGGNFGEIDANCSMVISCNPHQGRVFKDENIQEILKFLGNGAPAFITRMTLIYFFRDVVNTERDGKIAKAVLKNSGNDPLAAYEQDYEVDGITYYGTQTLRKFFQYVSSIPVEAIPQELHEELERHYVESRADTASRIMKLISPRFLRDAIKLAQMIARIQGQSVPTKTDIERARGLLEKHMEAAAFDPVTKELDVNLITGAKPEKELKKEQNDTEQFWDCYESLKAVKGTVTAKDWVNELVSVKQWKQEKAESWIAKAEQGGKISGISNNDIQRSKAF